MRTGKEYREALRDGRRVWLIGEGVIDDVTIHPATRAMVDEYAAWYDRHADPAWLKVLLTASGSPWIFTVPKSPEDLRAMGRCYSATTFSTAGNVTHTPAYGHLIALGVHDAVLQRPGEYGRKYGRPTRRLRTEFRGTLPRNSSRPSNFEALRRATKLVTAVSDGPAALTPAARFFAANFEARATKLRASKMGEV